MLERAIPSPKQTIQPGGFEQAKYLLRLPAESRVRGAMILSLTTDGAQGYAFSPPDPKALNMASKTEARQPAVKASLAALASQSPSAKPDRGNAFLGRSEEHTSELQSLMRISYAVFCLKKKTQNISKT